MCYMPDLNLVKCNNLLNKDVEILHYNSWFWFAEGS